MNFIKEYKLSDLSICDRLIDLFHVADEKELTYAGRVGGGSVIPEIKKSKDFFIEDGAPCGSAQDFKFDLYKEELDSFINDYLETLKIAGQEFVMKRLPQIQYYKPGDGFTHGMLMLLDLRVVIERWSISHISMMFLMVVQNFTTKITESKQRKVKLLSFLQVLPTSIGDRYQKHTKNILSLDGFGGYENY